MLLAKETIFSEDVESILGKSAQQIEKQSREENTAKSEEDAVTEVEVTVGDDEQKRVVRYIIDNEPKKQEEAEDEDRA